MKEIFLLTKTLLKSSTSESKKLGEKKTNGFGKILFYILIYGYIMGIMAYLGYSAINALILVNQPAVYLNLSFVAMLGFSIIQTVITSLNILYFSKDLDFLLPLPISSIKIIISKLICLIISQYIMLGLLILPGIVVYGYLLNLNYLYYVISTLALLTFPVIPVALVSGIVTLIMRFTKIIKNKDFVQYLTIVLTIFLIIAIQSLSGGTGTVSPEEIAGNLLKTNGLVVNFSKSFFNITLIMDSILNYNNAEGAINIFLFVLISIIIFVVISYLISKIYVKTVISLSTVKNKTIQKVNIDKDIKDNSSLVSYVSKEIKILIRNPIFFMQCLLPSIIFPIIIGVPAILGLEDAGISLSLFSQDLGVVINSSFGIMCALVAIIFTYAFNPVSVTAISRDGENAVFMKYIPLDFKTQIFYKAIPGIILNMVPTIYILIAGFLFIPNIKFKTWIFIIFISLLINIINNMLSVVVDLKNPKLKWISEYAVVKQNFNIIFVFLLVAIEIFVIIWMGNQLQIVEEFAGYLITLLLIVYVYMKRLINRKQNELFEKII